MSRSEVYKTAQTPGMRKLRLNLTYIAFCKESVYESAKRLVPSQSKRKMFALYSV